MSALSVSDNEVGKKVDKEKEIVCVNESNDKIKNAYISPISSPLLEGKLLEKCLKLIKKAVIYERTIKQKIKLNKAKSTKNTTAGASTVRCIHRGIQEVTKAIRKNKKGIVFIACDVFPIDIIAHLPVFCEEKEILYAFLSCKKTLGGACKSRRPASVLMISLPDAKQNLIESEEIEKLQYDELMNKVSKGIRKIHPWF